MRLAIAIMGLVAACSASARAECCPEELRAYRGAIAAAAELFELPEVLLWAVFYTESRGRRDAVSSAGAVGVAQLMPKTARSQGVWKRDNPFQSIVGGARYLRLQINRFEGDLVRALAAYNAGPGAVEKYKGVPPYRETQRYVPKILKRYWRFAACGKAGR